MKKQAVPPQIAPLPTLPPVKDIPATKVAMLVNAKEIEYNSVNLFFTYANKSKTLLDGIFNIQYTRSIPSSDDDSGYPYVSHEGEMVKGLKQGLWRTHFLVDDAELDHTATYANGLMHGPFTVFDASKTPRYQANFQHGSGLWKSYYYNSQLKTEGLYEHGHEQGKWAFYNKNGKLAEERFYQQGQLMRTVRH